MAKAAQSTKRTRRIFSAECKPEAVRRIADVYPGHGRLPSEQDEVRRLAREVQRLAQESALLNSAAAYVARESR